jgi:hypothetical protein
MRQLVLENLGLAFLGGIGGLALGAGVLRALNNIGLEHFPRAGEVHVDRTVVLVSVALSLVAGLFVGLFPIAGTSRIGISDALREESRLGTSGKKSRSVRHPGELSRAIASAAPWSIVANVAKSLEVPPKTDWSRCVGKSDYSTCGIHLSFIRH